MNEHELRLLVREVIARQLAAGGSATAAARAAFDPAANPVSFARFGLPSGPEGSCIIEPSVACNHCGFCKSYGH